MADTTTTTTTTIDSDARVAALEERVEHLEETLSALGAYLTAVLRAGDGEEAPPRAP